MNNIIDKITNAKDRKYSYLETRERKYITYREATIWINVDFLPEMLQVRK